MKVHPSADVQCKNIGEGTTIWQFVIILPNAVIGENCNINCNVFIENDVRIGNNVTIKPGVQIWDGISIGDNVFIGPNATFTNDLTPRSKVYPDKFLTTTVRNGATIGANTTILPGIEIGEYAMTGAGSVVTKNVPPFCLYVGNPAKHAGYVTKQGVILDLKLMDKKTGKRYKIVNNEILED